MMDALLSTQSPLLPSAGVERAYLAWAWGLALATVAVFVLRRRAMQTRRLAVAAPAALLLLCLAPGVWSPAYWLGLAFRAPSVLTSVFCAWVLVQHYRASSAQPAPQEAARQLAPVLIGLGWVLLLDVFAVWPVSLYALGFAPWAVGALSLLAFLPWLLSGRWQVSAALAAALLIFVLLRLPNGNAWDAALDPWAWLLLQVDGLLRRWRRPQR